jgi:magnesium chelatase accessory protein
MGEGPCALLLHGTGGSTHSWAELAPRLSGRFAVVAPDLPGHGFTSRPGGARLGSEQIAWRIQGLLETLEVRPRIVIGHSAGAAIGVMLVGQGSGVEAVVGLAPSLAAPEGPDWLPDLLSGGLARAVRSRWSASLAARLAGGPLLDRVLESTGSRVPDWSRERYARLTSSPGHCGAALAMMADWDPGAVGNRLRSLGVPALFLAGGRDAWIPPGAVRRATRDCPTASVEVVPGTGHLLHEERPEEIARRILAFSDRTATGSPRG